MKELLDLCVRHVGGGQYWKGKVGTKYGRFTMGVRFSFIPQEEIFGALVKSLGNRKKTAFSIKLQTWELYSMPQFPTQSIKTKVSGLRQRWNNGTRECNMGSEHQSAWRKYMGNLG